MATAKPQSGLPPLSPTFQATQLLTPRQLERITIDQSRYHGHLRDSVMCTKHPTKDAIQRRVGKMGDNYFFLQKELPIKQNYARTALQLSQVRPWDQIVESPMKSTNIVNKEIDRPFPQQHPYTSHISRFAMFPETSHLKNLVDAQTQTETVGNPPLLYQVIQKAGESSLRVECRHMTVPGYLAPTPGSGTMLWDLPRSQRHKRASTYPAPSQQYSRPPTAPKYLPLPSTIRTSHSSTITPASQQALNRIHQLLSRTTTYSEQYSTPNIPLGTQNVLQTMYLYRSRESHRPWTAESRGKYSRVAHTEPDSSFGFSKLQEALVKGNYKQESTEAESVDSSSDSEKDIEVVKVDAGTQTEEEYFEPNRTELPSLAPQTQGPDYKEMEAADTQDSQRLIRSNLSTPKTAESTRKLMSLFNGFNKTEILRRFNNEFPEKAPDLREYSIQEGKRHIIHGSHAYYYH